MTWYWYAGAPVERIRRLPGGELELEVAEHGRQRPIHSLAVVRLTAAEASDFWTQAPKIPSAQECAERDRLD